MFRPIALHLLLATAGAVLLAGCSAGSGRSARRTAPRIKTVNVICPISGMPVEESGPVLVYRNVPIGFCSSGCLTAWRIMTDAERAQLVGGVAPQVKMRPRDPFR